MARLITIPLSWIYRLISAIRNSLFDCNLLKSEEYDIPVVCVGNLSAGGSGKTPHTEMLISMLSNRYNIAVLSRGYKRKSKGYRVVDINSKCKYVGDEPKQIKLKYPNIPVVVCEKRTVGIAQLRNDFPETNLIILDDGLQHRHVETWLNILLTEHSLPFYEDNLLPYGRLREHKSGMARAQVIVVTKTPQDIRPIDLRIISKNLNMYPYQTLFFTQMVQKEAVPVFPSNSVTAPTKGSKVIAMSAIANNNSFASQLKNKFEVVAELNFPDHHSYKKADLVKIIELLEKHKDAYILTTEKDAVKFMSSKKIPTTVREKMFKVPIEVEFLTTDTSRNNTPDHFLSVIMPYVRKNHKHSSVSI